MSTRRLDALAVLALVELVVAFVLGGSGFRNDAALMTIELASLPLLGVSLWRLVGAAAPRDWIFPLMLLAGAFCLPLMQLLPLPPTIWNVLPGRGAALHSLALAGAEQGWRPLSLTPDATWRAFLWLFPPAALFLATLQLDQRARLAMAVTILALLGLTLLFAGLQMAGVDGLRFDRFSDPNLPSGLFANRNHQADALVVGLPLSAAVIARSNRSSSVSRSTVSQFLFIATVGLLIVGALVTLSRAGLVLGGFSLICSLIIFFRAPSKKPGDHRAASWAILAIIFIAIIVAQFGMTAVMNRFDRGSGTEARFHFWPTIIDAALDYFPAGAGLGAFDPVYRSVEPPETVSANFLNAAHNDYLQVWLEGGVAGLALLMAFLVWFFRMALRAWRAPRPEIDLLAQGATVALGVMLIHSLSDYPLRTPALACVFAVLCGFLASARRKPLAQANA